MNRITENKIILITRPTRLAELVQRYNTVDQARFYVEHLGADFSDYQSEDEHYHRARREAEATLDGLGRLQVVDRAFLPSFVFAPRDTIVVLGQDGLVANTLKYLDGQLVVGVNPDRGRWDGQLLPFDVADLGKVVPEVFSGGRRIRQVSMAEARLNNGQSLRAVNDLFVGTRSHGSARYRMAISGEEERHSSSGVIISTGLGSTGWFKSLITGASAVAEVAGILLSNRRREKDTEARGHRIRNVLKARVHPPAPLAWDAQELFFTVREPFPTRTTGASLVFGRVTRQTPLTIVSEMAENGVIFSDGIEKDYLEFNSGVQAVISLADKSGHLVI